MESAKQLQKIIKKDYRKNESFDVGCAAGHYLHNLNKIDKNIDYTGIDSTIVKYIKFAKKTFKDNSNCDFFVEDIFKISKSIIRNMILLIVVIFFTFTKHRKTDK